MSSKRTTSELVVIWTSIAATVLAIVEYASAPIPPPLVLFPVAVALWFLVSFVPVILLVAGWYVLMGGRP